MSDFNDGAVAGEIARLRRENRLWRGGMLVVMAACALLAAGILLRPQAVAAREDGPGQDPLALYDEMHRNGHLAIHEVKVTWDMGAGVPDPARTVANWSVRLLGCDLYRASLKGGPRTTEPEVYLSAATGPPEPAHVKAFQEHLDRMLDWEKRFKKMADKQMFSQLDILELRGRRLQAEAWLAREMHKPNSL